MKNEKIFITGGSGFLGRHIIDLLHKDNEITVYSRDEAKHYYIKKDYKAALPYYEILNKNASTKDNTIESLLGLMRCNYQTANYGYRL